MRTTGTYEVMCLKNKMRYVGSSKCSVENRISWHKAVLAAGTHCNDGLQKDYNRYGVRAFVLRITLVCGISSTLHEEQKRMNYWRSRGLLYNRQPRAGTATGTKFTKESRIRIARKAKARCTEEWRSAVSIRVKAQHAVGNFGRKTWSAESKKQQREKMLAHGAVASRKLKQLWRGEMGVRLRKIHASPKTRERHRLAAVRRSNNPNYLAKISGKNHWNYGKPSPMRGRKWTTAQRINMHKVAIQREAKKREQRGNKL